MKLDPDRWQCQECNWIGHSHDLLVAPSPFEQRIDIVGCPNCKAIDRFTEKCDVAGCPNTASCGWPSDDGYRRTCHLHWKQDDPAYQPARTELGAKLRKARREYIDGGGELGMEEE